MRIAGIAVLSLVCLVAPAAVARVNLPARLEGVALAASGGTEAAGSALLTLDPKQYDRLWRLSAARVDQFPLPGGETLDLEIASFNLLTPEARFVVAGPAGWRETPAPVMRFYRGRVAGDPNSLVSLSLFAGRIAGFIRAGAREWTLAPRSFAPGGDGSSEIRIWSRDAETGPVGQCAGEKRPPDRLGGPDPRAAAPEGAMAVAVGATTVLKATIAIEGTVEWSVMHGGAAGAEIYTLNLMSEVATIYAAQVGVQIEIPFVLMNAADPDGYSGATNDPPTLLNEMRQKWNSNPSLRGVFRTAAHLFSSYPAGGGGVAYLDVLCENVTNSGSSFDYGTSLLEGNAASWERILTAHELGHNFASPHTHCYVPELDRCYNLEAGCFAGSVVQSQGTIMSYCTAKDPVFHPRCIDEKIRPAAEAAFPLCIDVAGPPGEIRPQDGSALQVGPAPVCATAPLRRDDGSPNGFSGYGGTTRAAWIKKFTPLCYPFRLTRVDVMIGDASIAVGRPIQVLVYRDPAGLGSPATAELASTQDVTVQTVSTSAFNQFTLTTPVVLTAGDFYLGFYDLQTDAADSFPMTSDNKYTGDSWLQTDSTNPYGYIPQSPGTWLIRGEGGGVPAGTLQLSWGLPCNNALVPHQDYAIYQGILGSGPTLTNLTCSTQRGTSWLLDNPPPRAFWVVVPQTSQNEGSYGQATSGERPPALGACKPQLLAGCS